MVVDFSSVQETLCLGAFQRFHDADLGDGAHTCSTYTQADRAVLLWDEILAVLQVRREGAAGLAVGVADGVTGDDVFSGDLANA